MFFQTRGASAGYPGMMPVNYLPFLLFVVLPVTELALLIRAGSVLGAGQTVMLVVLTGAAGAWLARVQGFAAVQAIRFRLGQGMMPTREMFDAAMVFAGGLLLLTPGFITDAAGLILLFPMTRALVTAACVRAFLKNVSPGDSDRRSFTEPLGNPRDVEDADFHD